MRIMDKNMLFNSMHGKVEESESIGDLRILPRFPSKASGFELDCVFALDLPENLI